MKGTKNDMEKKKGIRDATKESNEEGICGEPHGKPETKK